MKRFFSVLMAILLLFTGSSVVTIATAFAEGGAHGISMPVSIDPNAERMVSGDWIYYINPSGYATITGYTDASAQSLRIPVSLGGVPVSAIDEGAFQGLSHLRSIEVHGNVVYLGEKLFADPSATTIKAWSGSAALRYARQHEMAWVNESEESFRFDYVDLRDIKEAAYDELGSGVLRMRKLEASRLQPGEAVFMPHAIAGLQGYVVIVDSVTDDGSTALVRFTGIDPLALIDSISLTDEDLRHVDIRLYDINPDLELQGRASYSDVDLSLGKEWNLGSFIPKDKLPSIIRSVTAKIKLEANIYIPISGVIIPKASIERFRVKATATIGAQLGWKASYSRRIKLCTANISIYAGFNMDLDLYLNISADGELTYTFEDKYVFGGEWSKSSGRMNAIKDHIVVKRDLVAKANAKVSLMPELTLQWGKTILGIDANIKIFRCNVEIGLKLNANYQVRTNCADVNLYLFGNWNYEVGLLNWEKLRLIYTGGDRLFNDKYLAKLHFEDWRHVGANCLRGNQTVTFNSNGGTGVPSQSVAWGTAARQPAAPTRSGYRFVRWDYNAGGSMQPYNFSTPVKSGMTLVAVWQALNGGGIVTAPPITAQPGVTPGGGDTPTLAPTVTPTPTPTPVPVTAVTLDKTDATIYTDGSDSTVQLTANVTPGNAADKTLNWASSNTAVAVVDYSGKVYGVKAGTATITATSISNPSVKATCAITVKQRVNGIVLSEVYKDMIQDDTATISATVYPADASNKALTWTSSDAGVATVDAAGKITAKNRGKATITVAAQDGSGVKVTCEVRVENVLEIESSASDTTLYLSGAPDTDLGNVTATYGSLQRAAARGNGIAWTLNSTGDGAAEIEMVETPAAITVDGTQHTFTLARLYLKKLNKTGTDTFTVTATSGNYSENTSFTVTVSSAVFAERATLGTTTFNDLAINAKATIPAVPIALNEGDVLPSNMRLTLNGDAAFQDHATISAKADGSMEVSFDESALYHAVAVYSAGNIAYEVTLSFYVVDAEGRVHLPVTGLSLNDVSTEMAVGDMCTLTYSIEPTAAYDKSVTWASSDPTVASVTPDGKITALSGGEAYITCTANGGTDVRDSFFVHVQDFLSMMEDEINITVYTTGEQSYWVDGVDLTWDSQQRMRNAGLTPVWSLERVSGDSAVLSMSETDDETNNVVGNKLYLMRMNHAGSDMYRLTCTAGSYSAECLVNVTVVDTQKALPLSLAMENSYAGTVDEAFTVALTPSCIPSGSALPEDAIVTLDGDGAFRNALTSSVFAEGTCTLTFSEGGRYSATFTYRGGNYAYEVPVTFIVANEDGSVPSVPQSVELSADIVRLAVGESAQLDAQVLPSDAADRNVTWYSDDTSVASVSSAGMVSGVGAGVTLIIASSSANADVQNACIVVVESGLTIAAEGEMDLTAYLDGETRAVLQTVYLTQASSLRLGDDAPTWSLSRVSGNNLTLHCAPVAAVDDAGNTLYGVDVSLYSISRTGTAVYDLTCTAGDESAVVRLNVNAVSRDDVLPAVVTLSKTVHTASIGELITVLGEYECWPKNRSLPVDVRVRYEGGLDYKNALNSLDHTVSRSLATFSFKEAGIFTADCVVSHGNVVYRVPVTFRIKDASGNVPVKVDTVALSAYDLSIPAGATAQLSASIMPADATNRAFSWSSTDTDVATVDASGQVRAISEGYAQIVCTPEDDKCAPAVCNITVEDALHVLTGLSDVNLYLQGAQENELGTFYLSGGTMNRLRAEGIAPTWTINRASGSAIEYEVIEEDEGAAVRLRSTRLDQGGTDVFDVTCTAGELTRTLQLRVTVTDLGTTAPSALSIAKPQISAAVGEVVAMDFAPILSPSGTVLPAGMTSLYMGLGEFYDALETYAENGDTVTASFSEPGTYLLTRLYRHRNLRYTAVCTVTVGSSEEPAKLISCDQTEVNVYAGGKSQTVATCVIDDAGVLEAFEDEMEWTLERLSGNHTSAGIVAEGDEAGLFVANVRSTGTEVWRMSLNVRGMTDSIDITVHAVEPRRPLPQALELSVDEVSGMMGLWLTLPIGVNCIPEGSALPDSADGFWRLEMADGKGRYYSEWNVVSGQLRVRFSEPGWYLGDLVYESGNVRYALPVRFYVTDEEEVLNAPERLGVYLLDREDIVYPEGELGVKLANILLSDGLDNYTAGAAAAYATAYEPVWSVTNISGDAASLSVVPLDNGAARLMLDSISGTGDVVYEVSCDINGDTYTETGTLHVAAENEPRPDPTLKRTVFTVKVGERVIIDTALYDRTDGSFLCAGSDDWVNGAILSAIGYEYEQTDLGTSAVFYEVGDYTAPVTTVFGNLPVTATVRIYVLEDPDARVPETLKLPAALKIIEDEAFMDSGIEVVDLRGTNVTTIGANAFRNCPDLVRAYIPAKVTSIGQDAFYGCLNLVIVCRSGSNAETYARDHGFAIEYM